MEWEGDINCIAEHGGFQPVCLDQWVLQIAAYQGHQEYERSATNGPEHKLANLSIWLSRNTCLMYLYRLFHVFKFYAQSPLVHCISTVGKMVLEISWP